MAEGFGFAKGVTVDNKLIVSRFVRYTFDEDGSAALLNVLTGRWLALDATAGKFWLYCIEGKSFQEACGLLSEHFGVSKERIVQDFAPTVQELRRYRMLVKKWPFQW